MSDRDNGENYGKKTYKVNKSKTLRQTTQQNKCKN